MPTILILDDSTTNRAIYSRLAQSLQQNLCVKTFGDPGEALSFFESEGADLVITDFKMPGMDGAQFTSRLRQCPDDADVPIIVVTAYSDRTFRMQALEAGATDFLLSPVDHFEFIARARNLLKLRLQQLMIRQRASWLETELRNNQLVRESELRNSRDALAQVIDTVPAMISATDRQGTCVFANEHQARFAGLAPSELVGRDITSLLGPKQARTRRALDRLVFETGAALPGREEEVVDANGSHMVLLTVRAPIRGVDGEVVNVLTTSLDITDRKVAEQRLNYIANHDALTDLPNRMQLQSHLRQAMARGRRGDRAFALHFLDLDRFKAINDGLGHYLGDQLLVAVARRLQGAVRTGDTVARLGGDEFAIIQSDIRGTDDAVSLAVRVNELLAAPIVCDGHALTVGVSIGITTFPQDGGSADELLRNADLAMYRAKSAGRGTWSFFAADMEPGAREAMQLESDLRASILRREFVLHYQPQIDLSSNRIVGAEALLRWQRPEYGLLGPESFLRIAEESGLIIPISAWVLREACRQAMRWCAAGLPAIRMAVNLSPIQFRKQDVRGLVVDVLGETGLSPELLDLELTEGILMERGEESATVLRALRGLGVNLSVDDFGTGYSSLNYVKRYPLDRLKIDQSFTRGLIVNPSDTAIVHTIIDLARRLRLKVVAEGVETAAQTRHLMLEGCDEAQGFYFSKPVHPEAFGALLSRADAQLAGADSD